MVKKIIKFILQNKYLYFLASIFILTYVNPIPVFGAVIFNDGFETGDLSATQNGAYWHSSVNASVSTTTKRTGNYALKVSFPAVSLGADSFAEQRFDLGAQQSDVYIRFYIYYPTNYVHRLNGVNNNNKIIRIWNDNADYGSDLGKMGMSMRPSLTSYIFPEAYVKYNGSFDRNDPNCAAPDGLGSFQDFPGYGSWTLTPSDLGRWIAMEFHFKRDSGAGDGALEFWVDGVKKLGTTNLPVVGSPCNSGAKNYFKSGYFMGSANSGYAVQTDFYIDDVVFSTSYIGTSQADATPPSLSVPSSIGTTKNKTPNFSFTSNEAGTITYGGSCSSATATATVGENVITLNVLNVGTYSNCEITVTDSSSNVSTPLTIPTFHITYPGDLDLNRNVNIFDYNILLTNFGQTNCGNSADIDGNCSVNIFDYNALIGDFGRSF